LEEDLRALGLDPGRDTLFGLYQGVALPDRGLDYQSPPDRIIIYRRPILEICASREEVVGEVRQTVLHELGHYFGLGEEDMPEEEY
jgi:predicted Zn-dependent protease with MMP-like domain